MQGMKNEDVKDKETTIRGCRREQTGKDKGEHAKAGWGKGGVKALRGGLRDQRHRSGHHVRLHFYEDVYGDPDTASYTNRSHFHLVPLPQPPPKPVSNHIHHFTPQSRHSFLPIHHLLYLPKCCYPTT